MLSEEFYRNYKQQVLDYEECLKQIDLLNNKVKNLTKEKDLEEAKFKNKSWWICYFISFILLNWLFQPLSVISFLGSIFFSFWITFYIYIFFGENIISEKIKHLKEKLESNKLELENLTKSKISYLEKLKPLEELIANNCINILDSFYHQNLYQKRSKDEKFIQSMSDFRDMYMDVRKISYTLITTNISIDKYKKYIEKRDSIKAPEKNNFNPVASTITSNIIPKIQSHIDPPKPLPPEHKYKKSGRINDWDLINKSRQEIGLEGEQIVVIVEKYYLRSIGRQDLADKVQHIAREDGDGFGYDVLSFFENGNQKYIEVKSTKQNIHNPFYMSDNELSFLKQNNTDAFIYRVLVDKEAPRLKVYSSSDVFNSHDITPSQYKVKLKSF